MSSQASSLQETEFDVIVLGTGLVESIVAGSLARAGQKVLHLDNNPYYGSNWSVFGFKELYVWSQEHSLEKKTDAQTTSLPGIAKEDRAAYAIDYEKTCRENIRHVQCHLYTPLHSPTTPVVLEQKIYSEEEMRQYLGQGLEIDRMSESDKALVEELLAKEAGRLLQSGTLELTPSIARLQALVQGLRSSKSYHLDLAPKLLPCQGKLIETLIYSGMGRYLEFKSIEDIFIYDPISCGLAKVPSSREDIFTNKAMTLVEKRKLMKFLTFAIHFDQSNTLWQESLSMAYSDFLEKHFKITGLLQTAILYAIALGDIKTMAKDGLESTRVFMTSMGRFGKGGYLCSLYGGGSEIAQAFCRLCAVYGGIYILHQPIQNYCFNSTDTTCTGIVTKDQQILRSKIIVSGIDYLSPEWLSSSGDSWSETWTARAIIVTDTPLAAHSGGDGNHGLGYSVIPTNSDMRNTKAPIFLIHQSSETMACPKDQYVTYLWTHCGEDDNDATGILKSAVHHLLVQKKEEEHGKETASPTMMLAVYYQQRVREYKGNEGSLPSNIMVCSTPNASLDFEHAITEAKTLFYQCTSADTEFLPPGEQDAENED